MKRSFSAFGASMNEQLAAELGGSGGTEHPAAALRARSFFCCAFTKVARCFALACFLKYVRFAAAALRWNAASDAVRVCFCSNVQVAARASDGLASHASAAPITAARARPLRACGS